MQRQVTECLSGLPPSVKIGAYDWGVILEPGNGEFCGLADFEVRLIRLWPETLTGPEHAVGILLHECLHVIFDLAGLGKLPRGREDREEAVVIGFENGLVALLRDNPRLVAWISAHLKPIP